MSEKMERFTQRARRILSLAQSNAEVVGPLDIMPCHILLGFTQEPDSVAHHVMQDLEITTEDVIEHIQAVYPRKTQVAEKVNLATDTKRVLEMAVDEARRMGHHYIGTEHLLLGVMRVPDKATEAVFVKKSARLNDIRGLINIAIRVDLTDKAIGNTGEPTVVKKTQTGWWYQITSWLMQLIGIQPLTETISKAKPKVHQSDRIYIRYKADVASVTSMLNHFPNYPSPHDLYRKRGIAHMWLGHYEDSVADLTKAIELKPEQVENYLARIVAYELQGELELALQDCNMLIEIEPANKSAYNNRTSIYAQLNEFTTAEADLENAYQLTHDEAEHELGLAELSYHKGDYVAAIQHFRRTISILPAKHPFNLGMIYWQFGKALDGSGDSIGVVEAFNTALQHWNLPPLKRLSEWLQEMRDYVKQHQ